MSPLVRLLAVLAGAGLGLAAGSGLLADLPEEARRVDLLPSPDRWSAVHWLVVGSWILGLVLTARSGRLRWFAIGWCVGVPVLLVIALVYNWQVWGLWGESPTIP